MNAVRVRETKGGLVLGKLCGSFRQERFITVVDEFAVFLQKVRDFHLGVGDLVPAAEEFDMGFPDHGDDRHIRPGQLAQFMQLASPVHPHFQNQDFSDRLHFQNGHRHADFIVEVGLGLVNVEALGQNRSHHVLGRGLAV